MQVTSVFEVSRTKECRSQETFGEHTFSDGLSDGRLPRPSEAVQPKDWTHVEALTPRLDLVKDSLPRAPGAVSAMSMLVCSSTGTAAAVQHRELDCTKHR